MKRLVSVLWLLTACATPKAAPEPTPGQRNVKTGYRVVAALYPVMNLVFPGLTMAEVGRAMINAAKSGAPKSVLAVADMRALAQAR